MPTMHSLALQSGWLETAGQAAVLAGTLVLAMMILALVVYAYKQLRGGGVEWPEDREPDTEEGLTQGDEDDEWKYY